MGATGLPAWQSSQPGQVGNQAALTVESVPGSRLVTLLLVSDWQSMTYNEWAWQPAVLCQIHPAVFHIDTRQTCAS